MFRCYSSSLLGGFNTTFTIQYNTQLGENLYVIGNSPELGDWNVDKAVKMSWNCGNIWDVKIGFKEEIHLQYKYFVRVEESKDIHWEQNNRDGLVMDDSWDVLS